MSERPTTPREDERLDRALRDALGPVPELPTALMQRTGRRARAVLRRPGEGTFSLRGFSFFLEGSGIAVVVLLAGLYYAGALGLQLAHIFGGG